MKPEIWKQIPNFPRYQVSSKGRVRIGVTVRYGRKAGTILAQGHIKGYPSVRLKTDTNPRKEYYVHALVLLAFVGPRPEGLQGRHLNGVKTDNRLKNLKYGTPLENIQDAIKHGVHVSTKSPEVIHTEKWYAAQRAKRGFKFPPETRIRMSKAAKLRCVDRERTAKGTFK